jgi:hypothetical protein
LYFIFSNSFGQLCGTAGRNNLKNSIDDGCTKRHDAVNNDSAPYANINVTIDINTFSNRHTKSDVHAHGKSDSYTDANFVFQPTIWGLSGLLSLSIWGLPGGRPLTRW